MDTSEKNEAKHVISHALRQPSLCGRKILIFILANLKAKRLLRNTTAHNVY